MKILINVGLALCLLATIAALGTAALWRWRPELVDRVDASLTRRYANAPLDEAKRLGELAKVDAAAALPELARLVEQLGEYKKSDRRYLARRLALRTYADKLLEVGRTDEGLAAARTLVELDSRDIPTRLWFGQRLTALPAQRDEGLAALRALNAELTELGVVARTLFNALSANGLGQEALEVVTRHLEAVPRPALSMEGVEAPWQVWWSDSGRFTTEGVATVTPAITDRYVAIAFSFPAGAKAVRFDPPASSRLRGSRPVLSLSTDKGPRAVEFDPARVKLHDMELDAQGLTTFGAVDPWWTFELPAELTGKAMQGRLVLELSGTPRWIEDAALLPEADAVQRDLAARESWRALQALRGARLNGLARRSLQVSVGDAAFATVPLGVRADNEIVVEHDLAGDVTGAGLSLRLPDVLGSGFALRSLEVLVAGAWSPLDVEAIQTGGVRQVAPGAWLVEAVPATLRAALPTVATRVEGVRIQGRAR